MPGPPPKPGARRPASSRPGHPGNMATATRLPASGRQGKPPSWPLTRMQAGELDAWREVWSTPQATQWERQGVVRVVARYVRILVESEQPGANAATRGEVRQLEQVLGLNPMSMLRLRWAIVDDEMMAEPVAAPTSSMASARARLRIVDENLTGA